MSRNKKKSRKKTVAVEPPVSTNKAVEQTSNPYLSATIDYGIKVLVTALLFSRFFLAAENADEGVTLGLVFLWVVATATWIGNRLLHGKCQLKCGWLDCAVFLLVAGHVISACNVLLTTGQKQHALNLLVEWIGNGLAFFMFSQMIQSSTDKMRLMAAATVLISIIAGLGLYQHYVFYPSARAEYQKLAAGLEQAEQAQERQEIQLQLRQMGVPEEEPARSLFLQRLLNSSEPFGFFALANTLAGVLSLGFVLLLGMTISSWQKLSTGHRVLFLMMISVVGYCLLLTKSRTAQVGAFTGTLLLGLHWFQSATQLSAKKVLLIVGLSACVLAVAVGLAIATGGVDLQVISEAPKSLLYRIEYWRGSMAVISENPILGVGPGNFRQAYLTHKLPESSEEIADPHNMILDVWANGGLFALIGLVAVLFFSVRRWRNLSENETASDVKASVDESESRWPLIPSLTLSIVLTYFVPLLLGVSLDDRIFVVGSVAVVILFVVETYKGEIQIGNSTVMAALAALSVHLLGAGGIGMPVVLQLLLLCAVVGEVGSWKRVELTVPLNGRVLSIWAVLSFVGVVMVGTYAYRQYSYSVALEDARFAKTEAALLRSINIAAENAPLSPDPWIYLAGHRQNEWRQSGGSDERATQALMEAISRNPRSAPLHTQMGDWQMELLDKTQEPQSAELAVQSYKKAFELYPTNARNLAKYALALSEIGESQKAEEIALQTLRQDQTNRRFGHVDKVLDEKTVEKLRSIVQSD